MEGQYYSYLSGLNISTKKNSFLDRLAIIHFFNCMLLNDAVGDEMCMEQWWNDTDRENPNISIEYFHSQIYL